MPRKKKPAQILDAKFHTQAEVWSFDIVEQGLEDVSQSIVDVGSALAILYGDTVSVVLYSPENLRVLVRYDNTPTLIYIYKGHWCKVVGANLVRKSIMTVRSLNKDADLNTLNAHPEMSYFYSDAVSLADTQEFETLEDSQDIEE